MHSILATIHGGVLELEEIPQGVQVLVRDYDCPDDEQETPYTETVWGSDQPKKKCVQVEYDLNYYGGDYSKVGTFAYLPLEVIDRCPGPHDDERLKAAFNILTGYDRVHIIHYSFDELYDEEGNEWED